ncbi:Carbon storage regulator [Pseudomonas coronafaciens pv. garcae]|uniref:Carbon storage regulator n=1 Tax=Pseudomonas coronafaciens pv. garcae TaxID=251653 RepID=A0AB37QGH5_9PSED|nr:Carbon storage regulator [Pseudomonas coronafaciens pv. garcae]RMS02049.1 Carbon storage regulator [Pseudomonas coronafaciens pv. garcae]RMS36505.1 Carbon storage regulator [Pseudomonas coronafaciens pv. garcae]
MNCHRRQHQNHDGQIRLGIDAPAELAVDRSEIRAAKLANPRTGSDRHAAV